MSTCCELGPIPSADGTDLYFLPFANVQRFYEEYNMRSIVFLPLLPSLLPFPHPLLPHCQMPAAIPRALRMGSQLGMWSRLLQSGVQCYWWIKIDARQRIPSDMRTVQQLRQHAAEIVTQKVFNVVSKNCGPAPACSLETARIRERLWCVLLAWINNWKTFSTADHMQRRNMARTSVNHDGSPMYILLTIDFMSVYRGNHPKYGDMTSHNESSHYNEMRYVPHKARHKADLDNPPELVRAARCRAQHHRWYMMAPALAVVACTGTRSLVQLWCRHHRRW